MTEQQLHQASPGTSLSGCALYYYSLALLVAAVVTFGGAGLPTAGVVLAAWAFIFFNPRRPRALLEALAVTAVIGVVLACFLSPVSASREAARRVQCKHNLKQIGLALHIYHDEFGSFPPAHTVDADGRPLHSWRVLVLPWLEEARLYNRFHLEEPWDSPHNIEVAKTIPSVFRCPSRLPPQEREDDRTSFVAVVDDHTIWHEGGGSTPIDDVADGLGRSILRIEADADIPWTEPHDLSFDEAIARLTDDALIHTGGHQNQGFFFDFHYGPHILLADGSVRDSGLGVNSEMWSQLLRIDDGRPDEELFPVGTAIGRVKFPRWDNWIKLAVFLLVALFPLPWVWLNPTSGRNSPRDSNPPQRGPAAGRGD